jgi:Skp family chaperone for outer membrane proteins
MTDWPNSEEPARSISARLIDMGHSGLKDLRSWDLFKWIVVALLAANLLLLAALQSIRTEIAELKQDRAAHDHAIEDVASAIEEARTAIGKDIATAKAALAQAISEMRSGVDEELSKANAKLDALTEAVRKPPPTEKPRR